ncbi:MAG: hypothetical protein R3300_19240 [Candidatus Promineifilaceae bacterium]|nr:hypothetical protein [Candidatus Promineifilaceae bacterium]
MFKGLLEPFRSWSKPAFLAAGLVYVPTAFVLGLMAPTASEQYGLLIASLDSTIRAIAFLGLIGLFAELIAESKWLSAVGGILGALGLLGASFFAIGTLAEYFGLISTPPWVMALVPLMISGFVAMILAAIAVFRQNRLPSLIGMLLLLPFIIFVLQFVIGSNLPSWSILIFIGAQAATMLAIGLQLPAEQAAASQSSPQPRTG